MKKLGYSIFTRKFLFAIILFLYSTPILATVIYVDSAAGGAGNGGSWTDAYTTLYEAINAASATDTVWVASGTYFPEPHAINSRLATFLIEKEITLLGGFAGNEVAPEDRDPKINPTILSGDIGVVGDSTDNVYQVIKFGFGIDLPATVDGFIIEKGYAVSGGGEGSELNNGGGVYVYASDNKTISNCVFRENTAYYLGGAIYTWADNIVISGCDFINNHQITSVASGSGGGAIGTENATLDVIGCTFINNSAAGSGGGAIGMVHSVVHVKSSVFTNNLADGNGGAVYASDWGIHLYECTLSDNICYGNGGAIYNPNLIENCIIRDNLADGYGSVGYGGGVYITAGYRDVRNSVFYNNKGLAGGGLAYEGTNTTIVNTIFFENNAVADNGVHSRDANTSHDISYSRVEEDQAGTLGVGTFTDDPMLDPDSTFRLLPNSPCIDAGDGDAAPNTDFGWNTRHDDLYKVNTGIGTPDYTDIGVYEFQGNSSLNGTYTIGTSGDFSTLSAAIDSLVALGVSDSVTFNVESGTYNEQVVIPEISGASDTTGIVFQSAGGDSTLVVLEFAPSLETKNYTVKLDGADYMTFRQMTLRSTGTTLARIVEISGGTKYNTFENNRFEGVEGTSELIYKDADPLTRDTAITISGNLFLRGTQALHWKGSKDLEITGNRFEQQSETALYLQWAYMPTVNNNLVWSEHEITALLVTESNQSCLIENNELYLMNGGQGVYANIRKLADTDTTTFINNFIYIDNSSDDVAAAEFATPDKNNLKSLHNTIHMTGGSNTGACFKMATHEIISLISRNNNFANMAGGPALSGSYTYGDYNNLYTSGENLFADPVYMNLEMFWVDKNYTQEPNSVSVNPYFAADTSYIPEHPALDGAGTGTDVLADIAGVARDANTPDIGVAEFTPPSPVPFSGIFTIGGASPDFETLNEAVDALEINGINGAVVFNIEADTLKEFTRITTIDGTSAENTVTFTSATADTAVITSDHRYTISLDSVSHFIFDRLKIGNTYSLSYYLKSTFELENSCTNIEFTNNAFTRTRPEGGAIHAGAGLDTSIVITGNSFNMIRIPVLFDGHATTLETGNIISNNTFNNSIYRSIQVSGQSEGVISGNNIFCDENSSSGILIQASESLLVYNNMIYVGNQTGTVYGIRTAASKQLNIWHNTVNIGNGAALFVEGSGTDLRNNILVSYYNGQSLICNDTSGFFADHNVYYSKGGEHAFMTWQNQNIFTVEAWRDSTNCDAHSQWFLPEFISETDLHINDLRVNNMGTPLAEVTKDIDGEDRDIQYPDIGADEVDLGMPMAGEYLVGPTHTFSSFSEALDSLLQVGLIAPVQFTADEGTYSGQLVIPEIPLLNETRPVTFRSAVNDSTAVKITYNTPEGVLEGTVILDNTEYIRFEGLTIENTGAAVSVIQLQGGASNNVISGCQVQSASTDQALVFSNADKDNNNRFSGNHFEGGGYGIYLFGEETDKEEWNVIENNTFHNQHLAGIYLKYQKYTTVTGNRITHPEPAADLWRGIYLEESAGYYRDEKNYQKSVIANNMIDFNASAQSAGIALKNVTDHSVFHNSVHVYGDSDDSRALNVEGSCSMSLVYNNILSNTANGVVMYAPASGCKYDYNLLYSSSWRFIYTNQWYNNLQEWKATGNDTHSIDTEPLFVSDSDLHTFNIELLGSGITIDDIDHYYILSDVTEDIDGDNRDPEMVVVGADIIHAEGDALSGEYMVGAGGGFETLEEALIAMAGRGVGGTVTLSVLPGQYSWQTYLPNSFPGYDRAMDSLIIQSSTGIAGDVVISRESSPEKNYLIRVNGLDNFVLKNITLKALGENYGRLIEISGGADSGRYEGNVFIGIETEAKNDSLALVWSPEKSIDSTLRFVNNEFVNGSIGILMEDADTPEDLLVISGNRFLNQSSGMVRFGHVTMVDITGNTVKSKYKTFSAILAKYGCDSLHISKNIFRIDSAAEYQVNSAARATLLSNNAFRLKTTGNQRASVLIPQNDLYVYHNTMVIEGKNSNSQFYHMGSNTCDRLLQQNNVMTNLAGGKVYDVYFNIPVVFSDHNNLYTNGEDFGQWEGTTYPHFTYYIDYTGYDANSFSADPVFRDDTTWYSGHVLHNNTGMPVDGIATDLDGNVRDTEKPDLGAEEFDEGRYSLGADKWVCAYDEAVINAGYGFDSYVWSDGSDASQLVTDTVGVGRGVQEIWVEATLGGVAYKDTILVTFDAPVATPVTDYCFNVDRDTIHIKAGEGADWLWSSGETTQTKVVEGSGSSFNVTVTDQYGCIDDGTIAIHYNDCLADFNREDTVTITVNEELVLTAHQCSDDPLLEYVWSTGDTEHNVTVSGSNLDVGDNVIWVNVLNGFANYCSSSDTVVVHVEQGVNVNVAEVPGLQVYPNPTTGKLIIKGEKITQVEVYNMQGEMILQSNRIFEVDLSRFPAGSYMLRIRSADRISIRKVLLQ